MGEEEKKVETPPEEKSGGKSKLVVRVLLICILIVVVLFAVRWFGVKGEFEQAKVLYDDEKYAEAIPILDKVCKNPVSFLRLRKVAEAQKALCEMEIALDKADDERSVKGYNQGLEAIKEAIRLNGESLELKRRQNLYTSYRDNLIKSQEKWKAREREGATPPAE